MGLTCAKYCCFTLFIHHGAVEGYTNMRYTSVFILLFPVLYISGFVVRCECMSML